MRRHEPTDDPTEDPTSQWEREMTTEFDRRVRDLHEAPLSLDAVRGRATRIRRTRRVATAAGVLAAAAVVVPAGILATGAGDDPVRPPVATATATDTAGPTPSPSPTDAGAIGVDYLEGATFHRADGTASVLPAATYQGAVVVGDTVLATRNDDATGNLTVDVVDADGAVVDSYGVTQAPVRSDSGGTVAVVDSDGILRAQWDGGEAEIADGFADNQFVVAVTGGPTCDADSDCRFFLNDGDGTPSVVDASGRATEPAPGALAVADASDEGLVSVVNDRPDDARACGGVYDETAAAYRFEECYQVQDIAPDGQHVIAVPAETEGFGAGSVTILDLDGEVVTTYTPDDGALPGGIVWLDDDSVIASVFTYGAQEWQLVQLNLDGSSETVVGPTRGTDLDAPFHLAG